MHDYRVLFLAASVDAGAFSGKPRVAQLERLFLLRHGDVLKDEDRIKTWLNKFIE